MEKLKKKAIKIHNGMEVVFPQFSRAGVFLDSQGPRMRYNLKAIVSYQPTNCFSYQNGVYSFIDESNNLYAIPELPGVYQTLISNGYIKRNFYVPFGWYEVPVEKEAAAKWKILLHEYKVRLSQRRS